MGGARFAGFLVQLRYYDYGPMFAASVLAVLPPVVITLAFQLTASLLQPLVGLYADKRPTPLALPGGTLFSLAGLSVLSIAHTYPVLLVGACLLGVGSSVFHPESSRVARMAAGGTYDHVEGGFYAFRLKDTADNRKELRLNDAERMGYMAHVSTDTLGMFNRQEGRLERTFYRALHELQRLRKERESNLALVSQPTRSPSVSAGVDLPSSETNNIQPPPPAAAPPEPAPDPAESPETAAPPAPEAAEMR